MNLPTTSPLAISGTKANPTMPSSAMRRLSQSGLGGLADIEDEYRLGLALPLLPRGVPVHRRPIIVRQAAPRHKAHDAGIVEQAGWKPARSQADRRSLEALRDTPRRARLPDIVDRSRQTGALLRPRERTVFQSARRPSSSRTSIGPSLQTQIPQTGSGGSSGRSGRARATLEIGCGRHHQSRASSAEEVQPREQRVVGFERHEDHEDQHQHRRHEDGVERGPAAPRPCA